MVLWVNVRLGCMDRVRVGGRVVGRGLGLGLTLNGKVKVRGLGLGLG